MGLDVQGLRAHFPSLGSGIAHFDGPGGTQTPQEVAAAIAATLTGPLSNRGRRVASETNAEGAVSAFRAALGDLLGVRPNGVVYGRSATQLTYDVSRALAKHWRPGDEVVVTRLDHDANVRPWVQAAGAAGASVRWAEFDRQSTELTTGQVAAVLSPRTRLVAVTGASNLTGTRPDIGAISEVVHQAGALVFVDGVHLTPHAPVDIKALGADMYVCSPYKFLGPHCGVLAAAPDLLDTLHPDKLLPSTDDVPERFEFGTLPYELMAGTSAAVEFLAGIAPGGHEGRRPRLLSSMAAVEAHEGRLRDQVEARLAALPAVLLHGRAVDRTPTLLFSVAGTPANVVSGALAAEGVNAPAGSFYAIEPCRWLGLGDAGAVRVGISPYTDQTDVDRLMAAVERVATKAAAGS
jgi:cysteine desulfurase family protein (TIGR01976 family)